MSSVPVEQSPEVCACKTPSPTSVRRWAPPSRGHPQFIPDSDLETALTQAGITGDTAQAINEENSQSRIAGLRAALAALAALAIAALFSTGSLPTRQGQSGTDAKVPTGSA